MGYPNGEIPMLSVHGLAVAGATFPVPIWHAYMAVAEAKQPVRQFLVPKVYPTYKPFTRGYYGYVSVAPSSTTTSTTTTSKPAAPPPITEPKTGRPVPSPPKPPAKAPPGKSPL
jgi:membrane carboxypeptidase/penicillin-binding protein